MKNILFAGIFAGMLSMLLPTQGLAWDTIFGHPNATDAAVGATTNLGKFVDEFDLKNKKFKVYDTYDKPDSSWNDKPDSFMYTGWLRKGSIFEDYGPDHVSTFPPDAGAALNTPEYLRYLNHYYDPTTGRGLYDLPLAFIQMSIVDIGSSPTVWAYEGTAVGKGPTRNEWSWRKAREYEFTALTARTNVERYVAFANMFRSVGQVAHLLEDMSQPGHVRVDAHVSGDEGKIAKWFSKRLHQSKIEEWVKDGNLKNITLTGTAPQVTNVKDYFTELAKKINENFYSDDTIDLGKNSLFRNFAKPADEETNLDMMLDCMYEVDPVDGDACNNKSLYVIKAFGELKAHKLAHVDFNAAYVEKADYFGNVWDTVEYNPIYSLDDTVNANNANKVLPMAATYAAGLIDYFFRGSMEMNESTYEITNKSGEAMDGTFTLYYDDAGDKRTQVPNANWTTKIEPNAAFKAENLVLPEDAKTRADDKKDKYILVFVGTLGSEQGAVAGKNVTLKSEAKPKGLLLLRGGVIYNLETKETGTYSGILKNASGEVVWRDDKKLAIVPYGSDGQTYAEYGLYGQWSVVDIAADKILKNTNIYNSGGNASWRGDVAVLYNKPIKCGSEVFYEYLPANNLLKVLQVAYPSLPAISSYGGNSMSNNGTYSSCGFYEWHDSKSMSIYKLSVDISNRSAILSGEVGNMKILEPCSAKDNYGTCIVGEKQTTWFAQSYFGFNKDMEQDIISSGEDVYAYSYGVNKWGQKSSCGSNEWSRSESYSVLQKTLLSASTYQNSCDSSSNILSSDYYKTSSKIVALYKYVTLRNGTAIALYTQQDYSGESHYNSATGYDSKSEVIYTPYLNVGGKEYKGDSYKDNNSSCSVRFYIIRNRESDKAIVRMDTSCPGQGKVSSMLYYVDGNNAVDLPVEHQYLVDKQVVTFLD